MKGDNDTLLNVITIIMFVNKILFILLEKFNQIDIQFVKYFLNKLISHFSNVTSNLYVLWDTK